MKAQEPEPNTKILFSLDTDKDDRLLIYTKMAYASFGIGGFLLFGASSEAIGVFGMLAKRSQVKGTIYESHFNWLIATYFYSIVGVIGSMVIGIGLACCGAFGDSRLMITFFVALGAVGAVAFAFWARIRVQKGYQLLLQGLPVS